MNNHVKKILLATVISFVSFVILLVFISWLISLIIAVMIALVLLGYLFKRASEASNSDEQADEIPSKTKLANQSLLNSNLILRKSIVSKELRDNYELLIDQLIELLPMVNDTDYTSELAWIINRMATEYLPKKSLEPYLALTEDERLNSGVVSSAIESIEAMRNELLEVKTMVINRKSGEFKNKAQFLKQRFSEN